MCHAQQWTDTVLVERPKVALVLSGGGARGAAHIGVIRLIEEMQIPIDIVTGTSMGAIVGGLYAVGYTADEMDSLLMTRDWKMLLGNGVPRRMQPYEQRITERYYQVNIPYEKNVRTEGNARYRDAGIRVRRNSERTFPKVLARPGLIDGQNLLNEFSALTITYHDSVCYDTLPRAFACVATDLVTGDALTLSRGFLAESMRASMSIPGVFYPVYRDSLVLVDGGVVNNYPVDVARVMGADIVIGVDLSAGAITSESLHTFPAIFERLISTMGTNLRRRNISDTDILIRPMVSGFPVMNFDTIRLRKLIDIGYTTAQQHRTQLQHLKEYLQTQRDSIKYHEQQTHQLPSPLEGLQSSITIGDIKTEGTDEAMMLSLLSRQGIAIGSTVTVHDLSYAIDRIYGTGAFSSVQYHLLGSSPYTLKIEAVPNPKNQVELGFRLDSEDAAEALLSIGINTLALSGTKFDLTTCLGINPWIEGHIAYAWNNLPQINASMKYWFSDVNRFYKKSEHAFNYHFFGTDVYLSDLLSRQYDLRIGTRYDHFQVRNLNSNPLPAQTYTETKDYDSYVGMYASLRNDLFNASYLPTTGYSYGIEATYNIPVYKEEISPFFSLQVDASSVFSLSTGTMIQPSAYMRYLWGNDIPFVYGNSIGGYLPRRYMRQQTPFAGLLGSEFTYRMLSLLRLELRQPLSSDLYLSAIANYAHSTNRLSETFDGKGIWGLGLGFMYNTTLGPLILLGQWNDRHHRFGAYFSFGYEF